MRVTMENQQPGEHPGLTDERADRSYGFREPDAVVTERRLVALEAAADRASANAIAVRKVLERRDPAFARMLRTELSSIEVARACAAIDAQNGKL